MFDEEEVLIVQLIFIYEKKKINLLSITFDDVDLRGNLEVEKKTQRWLNIFFLIANFHLQIYKNWLRLLFKFEKRSFLTYLIKNFQKKVKKKYNTKNC